MTGTIIPNKVDLDSKGPYWTTTTGDKVYMSPIAAAKYAMNSDPISQQVAAWAKSMGAQVDYTKDAQGNVTDSNLVSSGSPQSTFTGGTKSWDTDNGGWKNPNFFDTPLGSAVIGAGAFAAPLAAGALVGAPAAAGGGETAMLPGAMDALPAASSAVEAAPAVAASAVPGAALPSTALATAPATAGASMAPVAATTASGAVPAASAASGGMDFLSFLNSPGGSALINTGGGLLKGIGDAQQSEAQRQQAGINKGIDTLQAQSQQDQTGAATAASQNPLGAIQKFSAKNALMAAILKNAKPIQFNGAANGQVNSAVPQGGFDPSMIDNGYGKNATLASIVQNEKQQAGINPDAAQVNLGALGYDPTQATNAQTDISGYQQAMRNNRTTTRNNQTSLINAGISGNKPSPLQSAIIGG